MDYNILFYIFVIISVNLNYQYLLPKYLIPFTFITYWITGIFDMVIRKFNFFEKYKVKNPRPDSLTELDLLPTLMINMILSYLFFNIFYINSTNRGLVIPKTMPSFLTIITETIVYSIIYDIFFYMGHYILHVPIFYKYHKKHHSTRASIGISAFYMDKIDYFLEGILPVSLALYIYNGNIVSSFSFLIIGSINTIITHMSYNFPFIPYSTEHLTHHLELKFNYGIGFMDHLLGTRVRRDYN